MYSPPGEDLTLVERKISANRIINNFYLGREIFLRQTLFKGGIFFGGAIDCFFKAEKDGGQPHLFKGHNFLA